MTTKGIPFRPDYSAVARAPLGQSFVRAVYAVARAGGFGSAADIVRDLFPNDRAALSLVTRTDVVPADISAGVWGATLSGVAVGEFISSLGPMSAAARLIGAGIRLTLSGKQKLSLPRRTTAPATDVEWLGPGEPIGVHQHALEAVELGPPKKLAALLVATSEVLSYTGAEQVLGQLLREDISATLDSSLFDDTAAGSTRPAGLRNGLTPVVASTATTAKDKMAEDFFNLAGAIIDAGGSGENTVYICSPRQAAFARLNLLSNNPVTVWASTGLDDGDIVAVQPDAFCSAFSSEPTISLAKEAALVMVNPGVQMVAAGATTMADPARSLFQTDSVGIRVILPCAWCLRAPLVSCVSATWAKATP
jgi:hypothetical protein